MTAPNNDESSPRESADDAARLLEYAESFSTAVAQTVGPWIQRVLESRLRDGGVIINDDVAASIAQTRVDGHAIITSAFRELMETDIDAQRTTPLEVIRSVVPTLSEVLTHYGVPAAQRDPFVEQQFPNDIYDLMPHHVSDVDESLHEVALVWGAAKAHVHLQRHKHKRRH